MRVREDDDGFIKKDKEEEKGSCVTSGENVIKDGQEEYKFVDITGFVGGQGRPSWVKLQTRIKVSE